MSNLESAKTAIEAEIMQAKQGLLHYQFRIEALSNTLARLAGIDGSARISSAPIAVKHKAGPAKVKGKRPAKGGLPFTGGDYWLDLITDQPQSGADVLHAAIATLGFMPTKHQVQKMTQRSTFALNALVKSGKIQDSGAGRERRFFKR